MKIACFEDFQAWQEARVLTAMIYRVTRQPAFSRDFGLSGQVQRAAVSIMSNIAEGYERRSDREFARYLLIAKGSCAEVRSQLYVARDVGYLDQESFMECMNQASSVSRLIGGLHSSIERKRLISNGS